MMALPRQFFFRDNFARSEDGIAATEFALVVPVLLMFFFGIIEAVDSHLASRSVKGASEMMAEMAAREQRLDHDEALALIDAAKDQLSPFGIENATIYLVGLEYDPVMDETVVAWSINQDENEQFTVGSAFNLDTHMDYTGASGLMDATGSLVVARISYPFETSLASLTMASITLDEFAVAWPRSTQPVIYCDASNNCTG